MNKNSTNTHLKVIVLRNICAASSIANLTPESDNFFREALLSKAFPHISPNILTS